MPKNPNILILIAFSNILLLAACGPAPSQSKTTVPILAEVTPVPSTGNATPYYTFSSNKAGTITYGGDCSSGTTSAINGNNTIILNTLSVATHSNCTITVTDAAGHVSSTLVVSSFRIEKLKLLNDTGIILCGDYAYAPGSETHNNDVNCATAGATQTVAGVDANGDPVPAGQDAVYGRDANSATNSDTDGWKGLSYTKLSATTGLALATQNGTWSDAGSEGAGTQWGCVQDNVTGLTWEIKTNDGGLRDKDWTYSWYDTNSATNGGNAGVPDGGNNCAPDTARCDTAKYVADVNVASLCAASDWRLPSMEELKTLRKLSVINPAVDTDFIPNTISYAYWSASSYAYNTANAWDVNFDGGYDNGASKSDKRSVRLVRGGD